MISFTIILVCFVVIKSDETVSHKCRDVLACSIQKSCVQLDFLIQKFDGQPISAQMYNDLDAGIDYGCIFTTGCLDECNRCPLCVTAKEHLVDVLSGGKRDENQSSRECTALVDCAAECVAHSNANFAKINHCLRHVCAYHCFDGSCPKCSAFVTRIFNQICVSADLRQRVNDFSGQCYQMFRAIVFAKFEDEFIKHEKQPAIGMRTV